MNRIVALAAQYAIGQAVARHLRNATAASQVFAGEEIRMGLALTESIGAPAAHFGKVRIVEWRTEIEWMNRRR